MDCHRPPVIGIVGGVGSGKSAVARWVAEQCGGVLIDADSIGHEVLLQDDAKAELRGVFGESIFEGERIHRGQLAKFVFGDAPEQRDARRRLESIVHPRIRTVIEDRIAVAREDGEVGVILLDAAILLETGWRSVCDLVAFIDVPLAIRQERVARTRGWTENELERREASQWPLEQKREQSDVVIDNSGPVEEAGRQLVNHLVSHGWSASQSCRHEPGRHSQTVFSSSAQHSNQGSSTASMK